MKPRHLPDATPSPDDAGDPALQQDVDRDAPPVVAANVGGTAGSRWSRWSQARVISAEGPDGAGPVEMPTGPAPENVVAFA